MASCVWNNCTKNYQNLIIGFQVTVKQKCRKCFLRHSVDHVASSLVDNRLSNLTDKQTGELA